jgi:uncharacterized membrane protein
LRFRGGVAPRHFGEIPLSDPIDERLQKIEQRLAQLEAFLSARGGMPVEPPRIAPAPPMVRPPPLPVMPVEPIPQAMAAELVPAVEAHRENPEAPAAPNPIMDIEPVGMEAIAAAAPPPSSNAGQALDRVLRYKRWQPPPPPRADVPQGDLERMIGLKWAGWFGAIVLVIGAALGFRYAYDNGWLGAVPHSVRLLLMSLAGFGLIAAGEIVLRRVNRISAAGLYGAGTAVLFLVSYAGYEWYGIYARGTAFVLMAMATVIGVAIAGRARLVSIAVLSLIGGHLAPIILSARAESVVPFLLYLLFLQLLALTLCAWRAAHKWWVLRGLALGAMVIWQLVLVGHSTYPVETVLTFAAIYAALFQAELIVTTLRVAKRNLAPPADVDDSQVVEPDAGMIFSIIVTAQLTLVALLGCANSTAAVRGTWVLSIAGVCVALSLLLRVLGKSLARLSLSLQIQAGALLILAVPVLFEGPMRVWGWLALSIAFAGLAIFAKKQDVALASFVTWLLAIGGLVHWSNSDAAAWNVWIASPTILSAAFLMSVAIAAIGHILAAAMWRAAGFPADLLEDPAHPKPPPLPISRSPLQLVGTLLHALAALVWIFATIACLPTLAATVGLLAYAAITCAASFARLCRPLAYVSAVAVLVAAIKWVGVDELADRLGASAKTAPVTPFFNEHLAVGVLIAIAMAAVGWLRRVVLIPGTRQPAVLDLFRSAMVLAVALILTIGLSIEIEQAVTAAASAGTLPWSRGQALLLDFTILWSIAAGVVLLADRVIIRPANGAIAAGMSRVLLVIGGKFLLLDTIMSGSLSGEDSAWLFANMQTAAAIICGLGLLLAMFWSPTPAERSWTGVLILLVILSAGSVEISRFAAHQGTGNEATIRLAGWSIWWSLFAIATVIFGFAGRVPMLRIFGLSLFGVTLLKVVLVDLANAATGWRILSFIGLGALLLGTSVLYGRFGPKLLEK